MPINQVVEKGNGVILDQCAFCLLSLGVAL